MHLKHFLLLLFWFDCHARSSVSHPLWKTCVIRTLLFSSSWLTICIWFGSIFNRNDIVSHFFSIHCHRCSHFECTCNPIEIFFSHQTVKRSSTMSKKKFIVLLSVCNNRTRRERENVYLFLLAQTTRIRQMKEKRREHSNLFSWKWMIVSLLMNLWTFSIHSKNERTKRKEKKRKRWRNEW